MKNDMEARMAAAIVKKIAPKDEEEGDDETTEDDGAEQTPEGLKAAAEDIMAALGQDYGSGKNAEKGQRQAFEDKRDRLAKALQAFVEQCGE